MRDYSGSDKSPRQNKSKFNSSEDEVLYGTHSIYESLRSGLSISKVFLDKARKFDSSLMSEIRGRCIPCSYVPKVKLDSLTSRNHQGIVAITAPINFYKQEDLISKFYKKGYKNTFLFINGVTDVGNIGAIVRSAACFGVNAIIVDGHCGLINSTTMKTSAGALSTMPIVRISNSVETINFLKKNGVCVIGCSEKSATKLYDFNMPNDVALIVGSEDKGIEKRCLDLCDAIVAIPMEKISSLNVSVAAGIFIYETIKQKNCKVLNS